jgi:Flp pilus assembly pilin Flp
MIRKISSHLYVRVSYALEAAKNQRGAQAIEYVAVAGIIVALLLAIKTAMDGEDDNIAKEVVNKIKGWFTGW